MAQIFTLDQEQYEALVSLARQGAAAESEERVALLEEFLTFVEQKNGITRHLVVVKWQELDAPLPRGTVFPDVWPPEMTATVELVTRPVARADIDAVLEAKAKNPTSVFCTRDPRGLAGLTPIDDFFIT